MKAHSLLIFLSACSLGMASCSKQQEPAGAQDEQVTNNDESNPTGNRVPELEAKVGQRATLKGLAVNMKMGAGLMVDDQIIYMDGLDSWPDGYYEGEGKEKRVTVTGKLIVRHDLPVFIQEEGEVPMQGMPMPPGTDLHEASRRYLLTDFTY